MISVEHQRSISILWLDRPDRRNALTPPMLADFARHVRSLPPATRALVVTGRGGTFCSGFDLTLCRDDRTGDVLRDLLTGLSAAIVALAELAIPVVAACNGAAIAGGCALLGGADIVIADASAKMGYPVVRLGISPAVSAPFLTQSMPPGRAREWLLNPALFTASQAQAAGLVHEVVATPDAVLPRAVDIARGLASKPAAALSATKSWLQELGRREGCAAASDAALKASISLVGGDEEQSMLPIAWVR